MQSFRFNPRLNDAFQKTLLKAAKKNSDTTH